MSRSAMSREMLLSIIKGFRALAAKAAFQKLKTALNYYEAVWHDKSLPVPLRILSLLTDVCPYR